MLARLQSVALVGIEAIGCEVEVDVASRGLDKPISAGWPDIVVRTNADGLQTPVGER